MTTETNQLKLYSISSAARVLCLGKDTLYKLVAEGKIRYIEIGKRKKIPYQELVRFQNETVKHEDITSGTPIMSKLEIENFLRPNRRHRATLDGHVILEKIMRKKNGVS
jgi:excisionase family DNA binding protein